MQDDQDLIQLLLRRVDELERTALRFRRGTVTGTGPLTVALGGSEVPFTGVSQLSAAGTLAEDACVAVVTFAQDALVLGEVE